MNGDVMRELDSSLWNEINPAKCPCRGKGWILSDYDTWHRCRTHGQDVPYPDDGREGWIGFDFDAHKLTLLRTAYATFRRIARNNGFRGNFKHACMTRIKIHGLVPTPQAWVNAADDLADEFARDEAEHQAQRMGYSCALEMRLHEEAMIERAEWDRWIN